MPFSKYATHIPLNSWQKTTTAIISGIMSLLNPQRADLVAASNEILGATAFRRVHEILSRSVEGRRILADRPIITDSTLEQCRKMEYDSFGATYARFMDERGFRPSDRPPVRFIDDANIAYVALRYRQVHDFWHVLFECPTNMTGEVAVKIIEGMQLGLPNALLASVFAPILITPKQRREFLTIVFPWAVKAGFNSINLMSIYYEDHFQVNNNRSTPILNILLRQALRLETSMVSSKSTND